MSGDVPVQAGAGRGGGEWEKTYEESAPGVLRNNFVCLRNGIWSSDWAR